MPVSAAIINIIRQKLNVDIKSANAVSGGDINDVYRLKSADGDFLIKTNSKRNFPEMFKREAEGLAEIRATNTIAVPDVILQDAVGDESFLLMEWIDTGNSTENSSKILGGQLAQMHRHTAVKFGLDADNYMGSLDQGNKHHDTWAGFFIEERLQPMVRMAVDKAELTKTEVHRFEELYKKLPDLFTEESPSLIHGDLWGGNYLINKDGKPYLIDPAVSFVKSTVKIAE